MLPHFRAPALPSTNREVSWLRERGKVVKEGDGPAARATVSWAFELNPDPAPTQPSSKADPAEQVGEIGLGERKHSSVPSCGWNVDGTEVRVRA